MPIYEYKCVDCEKEHEILQKFSDAPVSTCPSCGGEMKKLISSNSFVLKGDGWYVTDYGTKKKKDEKKNTKKEQTKTKTDAKDSGKKTEAVSA